MTCTSSQGSVLFFLGVLCEPKSLFFGVWWHKGWLAVPDRDLSSEMEESSSGGDFSNRQKLQVARCDA